MHDTAGRVIDGPDARGRDLDRRTAGHRARHPVQDAGRGRNHEPGSRQPASRPSPSALALGRASPRRAPLAPATPRPGGPGKENASDGVKEVGDAFESARLLDGSRRVAALEGSSRTTVLRVRGDLSTAKTAAPPSALSRADRVRARRLRRRRGRVSPRRGRGAGNGPFADDAEFASIQAMEAAGHDADAAKEWTAGRSATRRARCCGEARLAQAWNALRRGEADLAAKQLAALTQASAVDGARSARHAGPRDRAPLSLSEAGRGAGAARDRDPAARRRSTCARLCYRSRGRAPVGRRVPGGRANVPELAARRPGPARKGERVPRGARLPQRRGGVRARRAQGRRTRACARKPSCAARARCSSPARPTPRSGCCAAWSSVTGHRCRGARPVPRRRSAAREPGPVRARRSSRYNRVLTSYFQHRVAASAQYRVAPLPRRARPARRRDRQLPGGRVGLSARAGSARRRLSRRRRACCSRKPRVAAPYFQIVLDRYARRATASRTPTCSRRPSTWSWWRPRSVHARVLVSPAGRSRVSSPARRTCCLGRCRPSHSTWRAYALLIDADASAAQAATRRPQATLERLTQDFPDHPVGAARDQTARVDVRAAGQRQPRDRDRRAAARALRRERQAGDRERGAPRHRARPLQPEELSRRRGRIRGVPQSVPDASRAGYAPSTRRGSATRGSNRAGDAVDHWEAIVKDSAAAPHRGAGMGARRRPLLPGAALRRGQALLPGPARALRRRPRPRGWRSLRLGAVRVQRRARRGGARSATRRSVARYPRHARTRARPSAAPSWRSTVWARAAKGTRGAGQAGRAVSHQRLCRRRAVPDREARLSGEAVRRGGRRVPPRGEPVPVLFGRRPGAIPAGGLLRARRDPRSDARARLRAVPVLSSRRASSAHGGASGSGSCSSRRRTTCAAALAFTRSLEDSTTRPTCARPSRYNLALCQRQLGPDRRGARRARALPRRAPERRARRRGRVPARRHRRGRRATRGRGARRVPACARRAALRRARRSRSASGSGACREQQEDVDGALKAYRRAAASPRAPERRSGSRRSPAARRSMKRGRSSRRRSTAYRDIAQNSKDNELAAAAAGRASAA